MTLVTVECTVLSPLHPRDGGEVEELLAVDGEAVDASFALADLDGGNLDLVSVSHRRSFRGLTHPRGGVSSFSRRVPTSCGSRAACCVHWHERSPSRSHASRTGRSGNSARGRRSRSRRSRSCMTS